MTKTMLPDLELAEIPLVVARDRKVYVKVGNLPLAEEVALAMHAEGGHARILRKEHGVAVALVHVAVNDENALNLVVAQDHVSSDSDV